MNAGVWTVIGIAITTIGTAIVAKIKAPARPNPTATATDSIVKGAASVAAEWQRLMATFRTELDELRRENAGLRERLDNHDNEVAALRLELSRVTGERNQLRTRVTELEMQVAELQAHEKESRP